MKRTPLYDNHVALGGRMVEFGGWEMPVQYKGIIDEHLSVRKNAGLFDVSHMGEINVKGAGAMAFLNRILTKDISAAKDSQAIYSPMCYPNGGTVDDLLVYRLSEAEYLLVVNAANTEKDFEWLQQNPGEGVTLQNKSNRFAQLALQGPKAQMILQKLTDYPLNDIRFFRFAQDVPVSGISCLISRTGYTGEDGFELYMDAAQAPRLWEDILAAGEGKGLEPIGLGARDTLRFEAALPLYGHELSQDISPLEAGLGFFISLDKADFIGKDALSKQKSEALTRKLVGFEMTGRGVPRNGQPIEIDGINVGFVTSGSYAPSLQKTLGLALIGTQYAKEETELNVVIRNKSVKAKIIKKPFYTKQYKK